MTQGELSSKLPNCLSCGKVLRSPPDAVAKPEETWITLCLQLCSGNAILIYSIRLMTPYLRPSSPTTKVIL